MEGFCDSLLLSPDGGMTVAEVDLMRTGRNFRKEILGPLEDSISLCNGLPVVSVGCGNGVIEGLVRERLGKACPELIGVDPAPNEYAPATEEVWRRVSLQATFASVEALIASRPGIVGRCILWLIWPTPWPAYDVDALRRLQPKALAICTDLQGTGCSPTLNRWLNEKCAIPARFKVPYDEAEDVAALPAYQLHSVSLRTETLEENMVLGHYMSPQYRALATLVLVPQKVAKPKQHFVTRETDFPLGLSRMFIATIEGKCCRSTCKAAGKHKCSGCFVARYCSQHCQQQEWPEHKQYCRLK
jgi:hypothetical protein